QSPARWKKSRAELLIMSATGNSADRINARGSYVNGQGRVHQRGQCLSQVWVCDLIAGLASLMLSDHNATVAQTGQMVGYIGRGQPKIAGKHCRIFRPLQQRQQNSGPCRIGHGSDRKSTRLNSSHVSISYAVFTRFFTLSLHDALPILGLRSHSGFGVPDAVRPQCHSRANRPDGWIHWKGSAQDRGQALPDIQAPPTASTEFGTVSDRPWL